MSKYKSFANQGSFSEFQLDVPDQTAKMQAATQKKIKGMKTAQQFLQENRSIYLEAQKYAQQQEEYSREQNFKLQNQERQAYKDALKRDYDIEMQNMLTESKQQQAQLQQISQLSQSAFQLFGQIQEQREEAQRLAAHDIYIRTGATYNDALALQKLNDNLTRQDFAASKIVQDMVGSDADPQMIDGLFEIYKNRNSKIWIDHKEGLTNSVNNYPIFADQALQGILEANGGQVPDIEGALSQIQRDFIEVNFSKDKIRPEVLEQSGVYKAIRDTNNTIRKRLLTDRRKQNKEELEFNLQTGFGQIIRDNGIPAAVQENSTDPTPMKRKAFLKALENGLFSKGAAHISPAKVRFALTVKGGGSNGQSINEAFGGSDEVKAVWKALRQYRQEQFTDLSNDAKLKNLQTEEYLKTRYNDILDQNGKITIDDLRDLAEESQSSEFGGAGYNSTFLTSVKNTAESVQQMEESIFRASKLAATYSLTPEYVRTKMVFAGTPEGIRQQTYYSQLALAQQRSYGDTPIGQAIKGIREDLINGNALVARFYKNKTNLYSVGRAQDAVEKTFRETLSLIMQNPDVNEQAAIIEATNAANQTAARLYKSVDKTGNFGDFGVSTANQAEAKRALKKGREFEINVIKLRQNTKLNDPELGQKIVNLLGEETLRKQFVMFNSDAPPQIPVTIKMIANEYSTNPLAIYSLVAPVIGEKLEVAQDIQSSFKPEYSRARNMYRYVPERVGRANIGDLGTGASAPIRPSVVQYVSGDPAIKGQTSGRIVYDKRGHGGDNYHNHYEFTTQEEASQAKAVFEANGFRVTSHWRPDDKDSAHSYGVAIDVAPPLNLPRTEEAEAAWSARANALIGFDPNE
tara:strand:+ start:2596 stop:5172 length:2577 start_codon:yes stop_codon:yes gene_type:complete